MEARDLLSISLNAHQASLDVRAPYSLQPEDLPRLGASLSPYAAEAFLLSTCQRFEAYVVPRGPLSTERLAERLAEFRRTDPAVLRQHLRAYADQEAARHLFRVAAGLDSRQVGEAQVLGQVRRALEAAQAAGLVGHRLGGLVQRAIAAGKRVRQETALGRGAPSVSRVAVDQARRELGDLGTRVVVVVGAGETAQLAVKALDRVGRLVVVNRTLERAKALADQRDGTALPWEALPLAVSLADLLICCVGAQPPAVSRELVAAARRERGRDPLLVIDLAVPRGVAPDVSAVPGVRLVSLDEVRDRSSAREAERLADVPRAEALVAAEVERAWAAWREEEARQAVAALRQRAEEIRRSELQRTLSRVGELPREQAEALEALTRAIVNKLLHEPTRWMRTHPAQADAALREVFGIGGLA